MKWGKANIKHDIALKTIPHAIHLGRFFWPPKYVNSNAKVICEISLPVKINPANQKQNEIKIN